MRLYSHSPSSLHSTSAFLQNAISLHGSPALILDCIKRGEDDEDVSRGELPTRKGRSIVVRVYESLGGKARGVLRSSLNAKGLRRCNVLEDDGEGIIWVDGYVFSEAFFLCQPKSQFESGKNFGCKRLFFPSSPHVLNAVLGSFCFNRSGRANSDISRREAHIELRAFEVATFRLML